MTVAEINALLYSPNHARDRLERALRIEALSPGWRSSFEALLQSQTSAVGSGNAGLDANSSCASGYTRISAAFCDGNRSRVRGCPFADDAEHGHSTAANGSARPIRGLTSSTDCERPATSSLLLAFERAFSGALSNQRED
jgi:Uncharacterized protein conserved in bacteria